MKIDQYIMENLFKRYNYKVFFLEMDMESQSNPSSFSSIFLPIQAVDCSALYHRPIVCEHFASSQPHSSSPDLLLTLIDHTLLLSDPTQRPLQPSAALPFTFDLKFTTITQNTTEHHSQKIGFTLFYDQHRQFSFYCSDLAAFEQWLCILSRRLNQKGFHQLFRPLRKLGKGNFASVYEVQRVTDHRHFAVKAFSKGALLKAQNGQQSLINEINVMRDLRASEQDGNQHLLRLEGVFESENSIYMVLELLPGRNLLDRIQENQGYFSAEETKQFMSRLLDGLSVLHKQRIMHRDLKPENIMLRNNNSLKPVIADFGLATNADMDEYLFFRCGTPGYVAPEIVGLTQNQHIQPKCDIFSAGVILHLLLTRKPLFQGTKYDEVYRNNKNMNFNLNSSTYQTVDPQAMDLMRRMLEADPSKRLTAEEALDHPYLHNFYGRLWDEKVSSPCSTQSGESIYL